MPQISWQTILIAIIAALITATASIIVALITTRKHPSDVSSSLMTEALDLVESLRAERTELRNELASLRTEVVKCREEIAELREENQKLRLALIKHGGTIDEESMQQKKSDAAPALAPGEKSLDEAVSPRQTTHRRQRPQRHQQ